MPVPLTVSSPDRHVQVILSTSPLSYQVKLDGRTMVEPSRLGLVFADGTSFGKVPQVLRSTHSSHDATWEDHFGPERHVRDHWNQLRVAMKEDGRTYHLLIRAFDDGVAIRYELPKGPQTIKEELTEFALPANSKTWGGVFHTSAEVNYPEGRVEGLPNRNFCLPLLSQSGSRFTAIAEADLRDWAGMFLRRSEDSKLQVSLASPVEVKQQRQSPWRVLFLARSAARLLESSLVKNLSAPSRLRETSWIKPGIAAWDPWWTGQNPNLPRFRGLDARGDTKADKQYIDLASQMGWAYQLVDWNWYDMGSPDPETAIKPVPEVNIPELLRYAKSKGVKLILWVHSKDVNRIGAERLFATYEQWGAAGVKIDFMDNDGQAMVRWYEDTLAAAARHHLMVNFHGAYKPTGLARTYPNYITQEGVLGNEYNKLRGALFHPKHQVTLPFTRGLLGPADITPGAFLNVSPSAFRTNSIPTTAMGTRCRQLALSVVMFSPLLCLCDAPENYVGKDGIEFYRGLPTVWDETRVLSAQVAKSVVMARRKGDTWYVAALNDNAPADFELDLTKLGISDGRTKVRVESYADGNLEPEVRMKTEVVSGGTMIRLHLAPAGGYVAKIGPAR